MAWELLSLHFKQVYSSGAYRYLDRCGEFMTMVEKELGAIPLETVVTGGKFEIPEHGIKCSVSPEELTVAQYFSPDSAFFLQTCERLSGFVKEYFTPGGIASNGFAVRSACSVHSEAELFKLSINQFQEIPDKLSKIVGMDPWFQRIETHFRSGSRQLNLKVNPITFENPAILQRIAPAGSGKLQRKQIERDNAQAARIKPRSPYAIQVEVDIVEEDPPDVTMDAHFKEALGHLDAITSNIPH